MLFSFWILFLSFMLFFHMDTYPSLDTGLPSGYGSYTGYWIFSLDTVLLPRYCSSWPKS